MKKKRSNPNNPQNSSMVQHVLEYKELGGSMNISLSDFLKLAQEDSSMQKLVKEADKAVDRKGYPDSSLTFHKTERGVEVGRFLSMRDLKILRAFEVSVDQANLVQASTRDIERAAGVDLATARAGINSLLEKGCIAIKQRGRGTRASIYMLNPEIATVGKTKTYPKLFWQLTGTVYKSGGKGNEIEVMSEPHYTWIQLTAVRQFTVGSYADGKQGDPEFIKRNVFHFLAEKKVISSSGNDETTTTEKNDL